MIEVDMIGAEPRHRAVERARDRRRAAIETARAVDHVEHAFRGQREFGPAMHHRPAPQPLVLPTAIQRRGVEQRAAVIRGALAEVRAAAEQVKGRVEAALPADFPEALHTSVQAAIVTRLARLDTAEV